MALTAEQLSKIHGCPIGSDHAGYDLKSKVIDHFEDAEFKDEGPFGPDSVDYPDFAHPVAAKVNIGTYDKAVLMCGSGNGIAMTANKYPNVRAALCWTVEIAQLARAHNDANILCIPARFVSYDLAIEIMEAFFSTEFEGGRHQRRVDKIAKTLG